MTEAEAKTKWCPFARVGEIEDDHASPFNRLYTRTEPGAPETPPEIPTTALCIGSDCMGWRMATIERRQENNYRKERPEGAGWKAIHPTKNIGWSRMVPSRTIGYCGLAGSPS